MESWASGGLRGRGRPNRRRRISISDFPGLRMGAYILSLIVNVLFKGIARPMRIEMDGQCRDGEVTILCVCNGRYYGGGFMPVGDAEPDDGILDMLVVPQGEPADLFPAGRQAPPGRYREYPDLIWAFHGGSVTYSSEERRSPP